MCPLVNGRRAQEVACLILKAHHNARIQKLSGQMARFPGDPQAWLLECAIHAGLGRVPRIRDCPHVTDDDFRATEVKKLMPRSPS